MRMSVIHTYFHIAKYGKLTTIIGKHTDQSYTQYIHTYVTLKNPPYSL
jgi:hypothetical protein